MTLEEREWFERQFAQMRDAMQAHVLDDERRLTVLEEWRRAEMAATVTRGTWAGIFAAAGLTGAIEVLKIWFHR